LGEAAARDEERDDQLNSQGNPGYRLVEQLFYSLGSMNYVLPIGRL